MVKIFYDKDANLGLLKKKKIVIMGYGSQGHAHANNLKESGMDVIVAETKGANWDKAVAAGFTVLTAAEAAKKGDIIMVLLPDELQADVYKSEIGPNMKKGVYLGFAHGFNIHFGQIVPPQDANVFMVAPKGPGHLVRAEYIEGQRRAMSDRCESGPFQEYQRDCACLRVRRSEAAGPELSKLLSGKRLKQIFSASR